MTNAASRSLAALYVLRISFVGLTVWALMQLIDSSSRAGTVYALVHLVPLVIALPGVWRDRTYTLQWASMLLLLYLMEGIIHVMSPWTPNQRTDGAWELASSGMAFLLMLLMVGPRKRAAKAKDRA